jgi:lipoprotein-anchoring transpeptidase ErfK/SrfK
MRRILIIIVVSISFLIAIVGLLMLSKGKKTSPQEVSIEDAQQAFLKQDFLKAKKLYKKIIKNIEDTNKIKVIQKRLEDINMKIIFSPIMDECGVEYVVNPDDALIKIAKKFNTTVNLIKRANYLDSDIIRPGDKLKVNTCKFSIVIDKSQNLLFLKREDEVVKTYVVATGKNNSTPIGNFKIVNKLINPTWYKTGAIIPPDSPDNILGSRWMGFNIKGYGIHGTTNPTDLGKQITMGCIRMRNKDVEEIFDIVPIGTEVTIVD